MTNQEIAEKIRVLESQVKKYQENSEGILEEIAELKASIKNDEKEISHVKD